MTTADAVLDLLVIVMCVALAIHFLIHGQYGEAALAFFTAGTRARVASAYER